MSLQVLAALDGLEFFPDAFAHFHSWEGGVLTDSEEFRAYLKKFHIIFSPYLAVGPLKEIVESARRQDWTMTPGELKVASVYEEKLIILSQQVVLESERDRAWYHQKLPSARLDPRSFSSRRSASFHTGPADERHISFIAGGRPVCEKGFVELCEQFALVRDWAELEGITATLSILCRETRRTKGARYIEQIEQTVMECDLQRNVQIEPKVPLERLRQRLATATALIVPSLYDSFCLMPGESPTIF